MKYLFKVQFWWSRWSLSWLNALILEMLNWCILSKQPKDNICGLVNDGKWDDHDNFCLTNE